MRTYLMTLFMSFLTLLMQSLEGLLRLRDGIQLYLDLAAAFGGGEGGHRVRPRIVQTKRQVEPSTSDPRRNRPRGTAVVRALT